MVTKLEQRTWRLIISAVRKYRSFRASDYEHSEHFFSYSHAQVVEQYERHANNNA